MFTPLDFGPDDGNEGNDELHNQLLPVAAREQTGTFAEEADKHSAGEAADAVDAKRAAGEPLGPLAGVPLAIKDIFCLTGAPTTAGSRILEG